MKTIALRLFVLAGMLLSLLGAQGGDIIKVTKPPFKKFVRVKQNTEIYQQPRSNSSVMVAWVEECEGEDCDILYRWSDEPGKPEYQRETMQAYEDRLFPVLGETDGYYLVSTLTPGCDIESGYVSKACVSDIDYVRLKPDSVESRLPGWFWLYVKDGKYKGLLLMYEEDELWGERLSVGVILDSCVAIPCAYSMECNKDFEIQEAAEGIQINKIDGYITLSYAKRMTENEEGQHLDVKKLSTAQISIIVDAVMKEKSDLVQYIYSFSDNTVGFFYSKAQ